MFYLHIEGYGQNYTTGIQAGVKPERICSGLYQGRLWPSDLSCEEPLGTELQRFFLALFRSWRNGQALGQR